VEKVFVQYSEHHVDDNDGREDQERLALERGAELGRAAGNVVTTVSGRPISFSTGMLSPVSIDSSTAVRPSTTSPSTLKRKLAGSLRAGCCGPMGMLNSTASRLMRYSSFLLLLLPSAPRKPPADD
jgi:hypothetical protein